MPRAFEPDSSLRAPLGRRQREPAERPEALPGYVAKLVGMVLAVGVLGYLLLQLGQLGKQPPQSVVLSAPAPQAQQQPPSIQSAAPVPARPEQGTIKMTSRVIEPGYRAGPGETLATIAAKFGTSVEAIASINNMQDRNALTVGQRLVIPNQD